MPDILDMGFRSSVLNDINGYENRQRKNESLRRYDIYQKRQAQYLREQLVREYSETTVQEMRIISSINLARRLVDKKSSLYLKPPTRTFSRMNGAALSQNELAQLDNIYKFGLFDQSFKRANRYYTLESQCAIQIIPKKGVIYPRVLLPHHYDVIPRDDNPDLPYAYIISVYDRSLLYNQIPFGPSGTTNYITQQRSDQINQTIADPDDQKSRERFIWWTDEHNFVTNGHGMIVDSVGQPVIVRTIEDLDFFANPIEMLPFVDVASEKEFEFWVRQGSGISDFSLDFGVMLSDTAEVNKRQAYSQAIVYSEEPPKDMLIGPHKVLHMKQDPNKELQPRFEWSTPAPNVDASIRLLEISLALFITSEGVDPKSIATKLEGLQFNSGYERLLAMIDQFEASEDDMALFRGVEQRSLKIAAAWSNIMQGAQLQNGGVEPLMPELQLATIPDDVMVNVQYVGPENVQTEKEIEDREIAKLENGLTSRRRAIKKIHKLSDDDADRLIAEIDAENRMAEGNDDGEDSEGEIQS